MDNFLVLVGVLLLFYALTLFMKTDRWDYLVFMFDRNKRKLARRRRARHRRFMLRVNAKQKKLDRLEMVNELEMRELRLHLSKNKLLVKSREAEEDLYVSKMALKELKKMNSPINGLFSGIFNAGSSAIGMLDRLGNQGAKKRKVKS